MVSARDMARMLSLAERAGARVVLVADVVTFRRNYARQGIDKGQAYRVARIERDANRIELRDGQDRRIEWRLDKWGRGQVESFIETQREFAVGDPVQFTRNDREAGRINGATAAVVGIDAEARTMTARDASGREHTLSLDRAGDRHVRYGWAGTLHSSQGATADRSMTHLESF